MSLPPTGQLYEPRTLVSSGSSRRMSCPASSALHLGLHRHGITSPGNPWNPEGDSPFRLSPGAWVSKQSVLQGSLVGLPLFSFLEVGLPVVLRQCSQGTRRPCSSEPLGGHLDSTSPWEWITFCTCFPRKLVPVCVSLVSEFIVHRPYLALGLIQRWGGSREITAPCWPQVGSSSHVCFLCSPQS